MCVEFRGLFWEWNKGLAKASGCLLELLGRHGSHLGIGRGKSCNTEWLFVDGHHLDHLDGRLLSRLQRFLAHQLGQIALRPSTRPTIKGLILADAQEQGVHDHLSEIH